MFTQKRCDHGINKKMTTVEVLSSENIFHVLMNPNR